MKEKYTNRERLERRMSKQVVSMSR